MQSFLTVLGYQFILVFTEYWCKQMPKLPVIFKICRDDWCSGYWLQNHHKVSGAAALLVSLLCSPRTWQKMPSPWLSPMHTHTLSRIWQMMHNWAHPCLHWHINVLAAMLSLNWGRRRKKKHNSWSTRFYVERFNTALSAYWKEQILSVPLDCEPKSRASVSTVIRHTTEQFPLPTTCRPLTLPYS